MVGQAGGTARQRPGVGLVQLREDGFMPGASDEGICPLLNTH